MKQGSASRCSIQQTCTHAGLQKWDHCSFCARDLRGPQGTPLDMRARTNDLGASHRQQICLPTRRGHEKIYAFVSRCHHHCGGAVAHVTACAITWWHNKTQVMTRRYRMLEYLEAVPCAHVHAALVPHTSAYGSIRARMGARTARTALARLGARLPVMRPPSCTCWQAVRKRRRHRDPPRVVRERAARIRRFCNEIVTSAQVARSVPGGSRHGASASVPAARVRGRATVRRARSRAAVRPYGGALAVHVR